MAKPEGESNSSFDAPSPDANCTGSIDAHVTARTKMPNRIAVRWSFARLRTSEILPLGTSTFDCKQSDLLAQFDSSTTMDYVSDRPSRWSKATVYPDMWADPDDDPRDSEGASEEDELTTLQAYLLRYRMTLLMKCEGLDVEQLARR